MQGESDAHYSSEIAEKYQAYRRRLMDLIRASFRHDDIPGMIKRISYSNKTPPSWKHGEIVRADQEAYAKVDSKAAAVVSTNDYG